MGVRGEGASTGFSESFVDNWQPLSLSPKDMDFLEAKNTAAREIAPAFGVPPLLLGLPGDNTHANYAEAKRAFYRQTVIPLVRRTAEAFAGWLGPTYGAEGLRLEWVFRRSRPGVPILKPAAVPT